MPFKDFVNYLHRVSVILAKQQKYAKATAFRMQKIEEAKRLRQPLHPVQLATLTLDTARLYEVSGNLEEAVKIHRSVEMMGTRVMSQLPLAHRLGMLKRLGLMADRLGNRDEAIEQYQKILKIPEDWERTFMYDSLQAIIIKKLLDLRLAHGGVVEPDYLAFLMSRLETLQGRMEKVREEVFGEIREETQRSRPKGSKFKKKKKGARKTAQATSVASEPEGAISSENGAAEGNK